MGNCCVLRDQVPPTKLSDQTHIQNPKKSRIKAASTKDSFFTTTEKSSGQFYYQDLVDQNSEQSFLSLQSNEQNYFVYYMNKLKQNPEYYLKQIKYLLKFEIPMEIQSQNLIELSSLLALRDQQLMSQVIYIIKQLLKVHFQEIVSEKSCKIIEQLCQITGSFLKPTLLCSHLQIIESLLNHQENFNFKATSLLVSYGIESKLLQVQKMPKNTLQWRVCRKKFIKSLQNIRKHIQKLCQFKKSIWIFIEGLQRELKIEEVLQLIENLDNTSSFENIKIGQVVSRKLSLAFALQNNILQNQQNIELLKSSSIMKKLKIAMRFENLEQIKNNLTCLLLLIKPEHPQFGDQFMDQQGIEIFKRLVKHPLKYVRGMAGKILMRYYSNRPKIVRELIEKMELIEVLKENLLNLNDSQYIYEQLLNIRGTYVGQNGYLDLYVVEILDSQGIKKIIEELVLEETAKYGRAKDYNNSVIELQKLILEDFNQSQNHIIKQQSKMGICCFKRDQNNQKFQGLYQKEKIDEIEQETGKSKKQSKIQLDQSLIQQEQRSTYQGEDFNISLNANNFVTEKQPIFDESEDLMTNIETEAIESFPELSSQQQKGPKEKIQSAFLQYTEKTRDSNQQNPKQDQNNIKFIMNTPQKKENSKIFFFSFLNKVERILSSIFGTDQIKEDYTNIQTQQEIDRILNNYNPFYFSNQY